LSLDIYNPYAVYRKIYAMILFQYIAKSMQ